MGSPLLLSPYLTVAHAHSIRPSQPLFDRKRPPHKLLLLQPTANDDDCRETTPMSLRRASRQENNTSWKGPLGGYDPLPRRAESLRKRRAVSVSATMQPCLPGANGSLHPTTRRRPMTLPVHHYDSYQSSPELTVREYKPNQLGRCGHIGDRARAASAAASYRFPLPPSHDDTKNKNDVFSGLGLDLGLEFGSLLSRRASSDEEGVHLARANSNAYDSDGLTGSQGWSPDTTAYDSGSASSSPVPVDSTWQILPLSVCKTKSQQDATEKSTFDRSWNQYDATSDVDQDERERDCHSPLWRVAGLPGVEYQDELPLREGAFIPGFSSPASASDVPSTDTATSLPYADHSGHAVAVPCSWAGTSSANAAHERLALTSQQADLACHQEILPEFGDSWSDAHGISLANPQAASSIYDLQSTDMPQHAMGLIRDVKVEDALSPSQMTVDETAPRSPHGTVSDSASSPIMSGVLAADDWGVSQCDPDGQPSRPPLIAGSVSLCDAQGALPMSPNFAALHDEFSTYVSYIDVNDGDVASNTDLVQHKVPEVQEVVETVFSPPLSDEELGEINTPRILEELPSPVLAGARPSLGQVASEAQEPFKSVCHRSHVSLRPGCTLTGPNTSVLSRGRPVPPSASVGSFMSYAREDWIVSARSRKSSQIPSAAGPSSSKLNAAPAIPTRSTSMAELHLAAAAHKDSGCLTTLSEAQAIRRSWREKNKSVHFANEYSKVSRLPVALVPAHPDAERFRRRGSSSESLTGTQMEMAEEIIRGHLQPALLVGTDAVRSRTLSEKAREALNTEMAARKLKGQITCNAAGSPTPVRKAEIAKPHFFEEKMGRDSPPHNSSAPQSAPVQNSSRPRVTSSTQRGVAKQTHHSPEKCTSAHAALTRSGLNCDGVEKSVFISPAPLLSSASLPTLFVARTPSQRRRGDTGMKETQLSLVPARAGECGDESFPQRLLELEPTRSSKVETARRAQYSTPTGIVLVVEEHVQEITTV